MIKYALRCARDHAFEGWFSTSADFDDQKARGLLECPVCGSPEVAKAIMAPAVASSTRARGGGGPPAPAQIRQMMREAAGHVRRHVEYNFDYVGDTFAREARAIHEGASDDRGIYGEATPTEVKALHEDGVKVAPLPSSPPPEDKLN